MRKHKIAVALVCVVFLTAAWGPIAGRAQERPLPGAEFGIPVPYEGWQPSDNRIPIFPFLPPQERPLPGPEFGRPVPYEGWQPTDNVPFFSPNDPYFPYNSPTGFPGQWHLQNQTPGGGPDANLTGAWDGGLTGAGVMIGIVDHGLQRLHPDLAPNYVGNGVDPGPSRDFRDNDNDPSPVDPGENHGTAVAGVAAAKGGNSIGVTGAVAGHAYEPKLGDRFELVKAWWYKPLLAIEEPATLMLGDDFDMQKFLWGLPEISGPGEWIAGLGKDPVWGTDVFFIEVVPGLGTSAVPEPGTLVLLLSGGLGLLLWRRRSRSAAVRSRRTGGS